MEEVVCNDLEVIQQLSPVDPLWKQFSIQLKNKEYLNSLINVIISPEYELRPRIIAISALKKFKITLPPDIIPLFYPLLCDELYQRIIAEYIIISNDPTFLIEIVIPSFNEIVRNQGQIIPYYGLISIFNEFVRIHKHRVDSVLQTIYPIITESNFSIQYKKMALATIIQQINLTDFENEELINQDKSSIVSLFLSLNFEEINLPLFQYILFFISINFTNINLPPESYSMLVQKLFVMLNILIQRCQLDPNDYVCSTIIKYMFEIFEMAEIIVPFDQLFQILIIGQNQLSILQSNIEAFFGMFIGDTDFFNGNEDSDDDELKCCIDNIETLSDTQKDVMNYFYHQSAEYIESAIKYLLSNMNKDEYFNLSMMRLFIFCINFDFAFNPAVFNCFENTILTYSFFDFCLSKASDKNDAKNEVYLSFLNHMNIVQYILDLSLSDDPIKILCAYSLLSDAPDGLIDTHTYVSVFVHVLSLIPFFSFADSRNDFMEDVNGFFLNQHNFNPNILYDENPNNRRFLSTSVFMYPDQMVSVFKNCAQILFYDILPKIFSTNIDGETIRQLSEIIRFFAGGNINNFVSRDRTNEPLVNMSYYDLFFSNIIQSIPNIIFTYLQIPELINEGLTIFASAFSNILIANLVEFAFNKFFEYKEISKTLPPVIINQILKIFIINEKLVYIDEFLLQLLLEDDTYVYHFISELSFIIINKFYAYSSEIILSIVKVLIRIFYKYSNQQNESYFNYSVFQSVMLIFARVALSLGKKAIETLINCLPIKEGRDGIDIFITHSFGLLHSNNFFDNLMELEQRLLILFFFMLSDHPHAIQAAQYLLLKMLNTLNLNFTKDHKDYITVNSTFSLIKEDIFYDDVDFLTHDLISCSLNQFIAIIGNNPVHQRVSEVSKEFLNKYPNL